MKNKKKFAGMMMVGLLSMTLAACQSNKKEANATTDKTTKVTVLGTSDIHGRYMPWDYSVDEENLKGSLSQIATAVKEVREHEQNVILIDEGDFIQGNSAELFQDMDDHPGIQAMNEIGYNVFVLGNHEFDYGIKKLDALTKQMNFPTLAGNLYKTGSGKSYYPSTTIIEKEGIKLGIIGITTPMVYEFKEDTDIFDGYEFKDTLEVTRQAIDDLSGKVDSLIGVYHMGVQNENEHPNTGLADIAKEFPEFDVIFGGHMHALENTEINGVLIVEPDKYATHLSRVDLEFDQSGSKTKLAKKEAENIEIASYSSDSSVEKILKKGHDLARDDANIVIGQLTDMDFSPENKTPQIPIHQIQETPMTNFFSEMMLHYSNGADVVAHQIDNDYAQIKQGDIKKKDIASTYQYAGGEVTLFEMTGKDLKDYMEWSAGYFNQAKPGDVTISFNPERRDSKYSTHDIFGGIKYTFNLTEEAGNRVKDLTWLDGSPVKMDEKIKVGMNAYRLKYLISEEGPLAGREFKQLYSTVDETAYGETDGTIRSLAARYIKEEKDGSYAGHLVNHWQLTGVETTPDYIETLIAQDIIDLGTTESGKGNIQSVNITAIPSNEEKKVLAEKAGIDYSDVKDPKTFEELYQHIYKQIK